MIPPALLPLVSEDGDIGEIVAGLGFSSGKANLDSTLVGKGIGSRSHVAIVLSRPGHAHLGKQGAAAVVVVGEFLEDENGESFFLATVGDGGEVELGDGDRLADQLLGGDFFAAGHEVGQGQSLGGDFSKAHNFSPAVWDASHKIFEE